MTQREINRWNWVGRIAVLTIVAMLGVGIHHSIVRAQTQVRPRFEQVYREETNKHLGQGAGTQTVILDFKVWHDKESGQEIVCADPSTSLMSAYKISCWPTGRNWK